jgi:hypothetical protein
MLKWISKLRRRSAIRKYVRKLGPRLAKRYGVSKTYSAGQIKTTAVQERLPPNLIWYGYSSFMSREDFYVLHQELGQSYDYDTLRSEVADLCFSGNTDFSPTEAMAYGAAAGALGIGSLTAADVGGDAAGGDQ